MNYTDNFKKFTLLLLILFHFAATSFAQAAKFPEPRQEKLLNGLKLLVWNTPGAEKVTVKLRVHSGSAFDPQGKEGVMALLGAALFPGEAQREFFTEDLGGSLQITSNFDYIQINATAKSDQFLTVLETLAAAVTNPQIDKEVTAGVVAARLARVRQLEKSPLYIADQAVAKKLFGEFPYGRPSEGTSQSLAKIDFADLLFARQRFLTADNATLAIAGSVKPDLAFRAVRRYFGAWEKADKKVPATFRQPDAPNTESLRIETDDWNLRYVRFAVRGLARNDKDFAAAEIYRAALSESLNPDSKIVDKVLTGVQGSGKSYLLGGRYDLTISGTDKAEKINELKIADFQKVFSEPISQTEFLKGKASVIKSLNEQTDSIEKIADWWLDIDTYKLPTVAEQFRLFDAVTLENVQRVALRFQKEPVVSVFMIGKSKNQSPSNQ